MKISETFSCESRIFLVYLWVVGVGGIFFSFWGELVVRPMAWFKLNKVEVSNGEVKIEVNIDNCC